MPSPFPPPADIDLEPPDHDEAVLICRGLASASSGPGGLTPLQDVVLSAVTKAMTGFEVDFAHLDPITPAGFADGLARRDEAFRTAEGPRDRPIYDATEVPSELHHNWRFMERSLR